MSDRPDDTDDRGRPPSLADRALDLFVFAPAGAVLSALEDVPGMAARGRTVIEREMRNAHLVGRFAVGEGQRRLRRGIVRLGSGTGATPSTGPVDATASAGSAAEPPAPVPAAEPPVAVPAADAVAGTGAGGEDLGGPASADLAIPGYDTLSASQVVRRLDGLGPHELAAVLRHESATRGRRTIQHRAQQLLGQAEQPPPAGT